ncbi:MAG TPA: hypothetical protein VMU11_04425 [Verrucomicrobiae bacterium]|nr:hypothetical protein [Verrucomicrobiae bacterium]
MEIKTILIVDDDQPTGRSLYRVVRALLEKLGPGDPLTDTAVHFLHGNGRTVLAFLDESPKIAAGRILLITDGRMPGMDGAALIEEMRTRMGDRLTAVLVSGTSSDYAAFARDLDFALLDKPFNREDIETFVCAFLGTPAPSS